MRAYGKRLIGIDTKFDLNPARLPTLVGSLSDYAFKGRLAFAGILSDELKETIKACLEVSERVLTLSPLLGSGESHGSGPR